PVPTRLPVTADDGQAFAVGAEADAVNPVRAPEGEDFLTRLRVPHLQLSNILPRNGVPGAADYGAAGYAVAAGAETDTGKPLCAHLEGKAFLAALRVPHLQLARAGGSAPSASQAFAVRTEADIAGMVFVPPEGKDFLACLPIPQTNRPVHGGDGEAVAVG